MWKELTTLEQLESIWERSSTRKQVLFKHSRRCGISRMAKKQFEQSLSENVDADVYLLDLLAHRDISNAIAQRSGVEHQSPQLVVLEGGKVTHHASHYEIDAAQL